MIIKTMMMMMIAVHLSSVIYVISRKLQKLAQFLSRAVATYYDDDDDDPVPSYQVNLLSSPSCYLQRSEFKTTIFSVRL